MQCTSRWAMARGHRLNTSIVLSAVHGLSGLFRAVSAVELFTLSLFTSHSVPVPNRPTRLCGRKATLNQTSSDNALLLGVGKALVTQSDGRQIDSALAVLSSEAVHTILSFVVNETLKCLSLLPTLMQESFWWVFFMLLYVHRGGMTY